MPEVSEQTRSLTTHELVVIAHSGEPAHIVALFRSDHDAECDEAGTACAEPHTEDVRRADARGGQPTSLAIRMNTLAPQVVSVRIVVALDNPHHVFSDAGPVVVDVFDALGANVLNHRLTGVSGASAAVAVELERTENGWQISGLNEGHPAGLAGVLAENHLRVGGPVEHVQPEQELLLSADRPLPLLVNQTVRLRTDAGTDLQYLRMGLGWDPVPGAQGSDHADLDAAALIFDRDHYLLDAVYFAQLTSRDGAIRHLGDSLTGIGKGENEVISVDLTRVHHQVATIVFVITSYQGQTFERIRNAFCRVVDGVDDKELAHFDLAGDGTHTGVIAAKLYLARSGWKLQAIGRPIAATHPGEAVAQLGPYLA
ncbi:TerD family protein [Nocardia puris]|uniref:Stress response protein SCP2 n=1 Tax=Nocardia puris TaxID=208602 RepID=A0A366D961_9NOCA|nr:TerD family protein [Nocardia puris]RBO86580.1 stress response protein SCP2 [Nocardia puris]